MSNPSGDNILKNRHFLKTFLSVLTMPGTPASIQLQLQLQQQQQQQQQVYNKLRMFKIVFLILNYYQRRFFHLLFNSVRKRLCDPISKRKHNLVTWD